MKLLFSSLLFALAAASKQEGRGLQQATSPTALRDRWDMDEPKINYVPDDDKFTFTFMTASEDNYNQGLAESFWDPDCMPVDGGDGVQIGTPLIHRVGNENELPFFTMEDVTLDPVPVSGSSSGRRPEMEFKINPAKFASDGGSTVYSGTVPLYSEVAGSTIDACTDTSTVVDFGIATDSTSCPHDSTSLFDISATKDGCYQRCYVESNCEFFTFSSLNGGRCMGCTSLGDASYPALKDLGFEDTTPTVPLNLCEGDCDNNSECEGDLVCAERHASNVMTVSRCSGSINGLVGVDERRIPHLDFCIDQSEYSNFAMCQRRRAPARIDFCIRSSLGYTVNNGQASINQNNPTSDSNYQEVNFIETLVRIEYDMSSGFAVEAFSVAPKNRELTTISESYENSLIAYLCDTTDTVAYEDSGAKVYDAPKALTEFNLVNDDSDSFDCDPFDSDPTLCAASVDAVAACTVCGGGVANPSGKKFNQGDLITVCVRVKEEFASQNIVLKELTEFSWTRSGDSTFNRAIGGGDGADTITQVAIEGSVAAGNYLTSYDPAACLNKYSCDFASVLFAQFYNTPGSVTGTGDAILQFQTTGSGRRLGSVDERSLQEDPGSAGMDISIDVNAVAEGPGDLKTAGGSSFGATTISVSVVTALIGAILLA